MLLVLQHLRARRRNTIGAFDNPTFWPKWFLTDRIPQSSIVGMAVVNTRVVFYNIFRDAAHVDCWDCSSGSLNIVGRTLLTLR